MHREDAIFGRWMANLSAGGRRTVRSEQAIFRARRAIFLRPKPIFRHGIFQAQQGSAHNRAMIRVLIVDDQALFRESLGHLIAREPDMEVGRQCAAVEEAMEALRGEKVDVVLASGRMGRQFLEAARGAGAGESVLMIARGTEAEDSVAALQLGARGILSR